MLSIGPAAYGAGEVASGQASLGAVGSLLTGIAVGVAAFLLARRYYRRHKARRASAAGRHGSAEPASAADPAPAADEES